MPHLFFSNLRIHVSSLFQQVQSDLCYPAGFDAGHAAVVDGTLPQQARATVDILPDHAGQRAGWTGGDVVGGQPRVACH